MEFEIILKKINHNLTEEERIIFDNWFNESPEHQAYYNKVVDNYLKGDPVVNVNSGWDSISNKIKPRPKKKNYFKYAAVFTALFAIASFIFLTNTSQKNIIVDNNIPAKNDSISIGSNKAILTLEDGSNVALEKGKIYKSENKSSNGDQLVYTKEKNSKEDIIAYNLITIPRGGQFFLSLSDGTKVWLNSESKLKYPIAFKENTPREVELLYGEAFFDVSASENHSGSHFIVTQNKQKVEVLGTEFNVRAYTNDPLIATTLVEGKIMLNTESKSSVLSPGQQSILNTKTNKVNINHINVYDEVSWKSGYFSFKNKSLEDLTKVLSRWYDIDFVFVNNDVKQITFNGVFKKSQQITEILNAIENTNEVTYSINQKTITMK